MRDYLGVIPLGTREPVLLLAVTWLDADRCRLTCQRGGRAYMTVVTARGWQAVRAALVLASADVAA